MIVDIISESVNSMFGHPFLKKYDAYQNVHEYAGRTTRVKITSCEGVENRIEQCCAAHICSMLSTILNKLLSLNPACNQV